MTTIQKPHVPRQTQAGTFGLLANGSSGAWEIALDEALSGAERWRAQIEGPSVSLQFEVPSLDIVGKIARLLATRSAKTKRPSNGSKRGGSVVLGGNNLVPMSLVKDDEYDDRFFFVVGPPDGLTVRLVIAGASRGHC